MMGRGGSHRQTKTVEVPRTTEESMPSGGGEMGQSLYVPVTTSSILGDSGSVSAPISPISPPPIYALHGPRASSVPISSSSSSIDQSYPLYEVCPQQQLHQSYPPLYMQQTPGTPPTHSTHPTHIPNIVIDPVSARDSYGHSRTPPFVMPHLSPWQLGIPGNGRKARTNSDSALYEVEKKQQQGQALSLAHCHLTPSISSERLHLEHISLSDSPVAMDTPRFTYQQQELSSLMTTSTTTADIVTFHPTLLGRQVSHGFVMQPTEKVTSISGDSGSVVAMETESSTAAESPEKETVQEEALNLQKKELPGKRLKPGEPPPTVEKQTVPFIWKFQPEKTSRSHSPKTYWIRRHSDSTLQTEPQNLTISHDVQQRSHSTGESFDSKAAAGGAGATGESFRSSLSESIDSPEQMGSETTGSAKRMKLKTSLLERFLRLQSEESMGSGQTSVESDDVFSPSPGVFTSRTFSFSPERIHGLQSSVSSSGDSPVKYQSDVGRDDSQGAMDLSQSSVKTKDKGKGGVGRPVRPLYVRTEVTSSVSSEEPETPVFFSPSMFSPRSIGDSPLQSGSVFQFQSPVQSRSPSLEKSDSPLPQRTKPQFQPSPLAQEPHSPLRPPFRRSPSPLSQEPSPAAISTEGLLPEDHKQQQRGALSPRDPQSPLVPRLMPTIREHSHPAVIPYSVQHSKSTERYSTSAPYNRSEQGYTMTHPKQITVPKPPHSLSSYSQEMKPNPRGTYTQEVKQEGSEHGEAYLSQTLSPTGVSTSVVAASPEYKSMPALTPIPPLEMMLRHPSFTQGSPTSLQQGSQRVLNPSLQQGSQRALNPSLQQGTTQYSGVVGTSQLHQGSQLMLGLPHSGTIGTLQPQLGSSITGGLPQQPHASSIGLLQSSQTTSTCGPLSQTQQVVAPYPKSHLPSSPRTQQSSPYQRYPDYTKATPSGSAIGSRTQTTPFQSYVGFVQSSSGSGTAPSPTQWSGEASPAATTMTAIKRGDGAKGGESAKVVAFPFSEKVQEQRYQQDPHQSFVCPVCNNMFPSYQYLANHMVSHLPSETITKGPGEGNKIHICKVCNKSFSRSDMLTRHMRLHTGLRPYECTLCGQVFSRSDHLNTHTRTHTGEKPYRCVQCPYAAPRRDMITRHMRIHNKQKRGRRNSSTGSADTQQSSFSSQESADSEKRRNQSLSSLESVDFPIDPGKYRRHSLPSGELPPTPDYDSRRARHWSLTSMEGSESGSDLPPTPSTPSSHYVHQWDVAKKRSWSATSESSEPPRDRGDRFINIEGDPTRLRVERLTGSEQLTSSAGDKYCFEIKREERSSVSDASVTMDTEGTQSTLVSSGTSEEMSPSQISLQKCLVTGESSPSSGSDTTTIRTSGGDGRTTFEYMSTTERTSSEYPSTTGRTSSEYPSTTGRTSSEYPSTTGRTSSEYQMSTSSQRAAVTPPSEQKQKPS